MRTHPTILGISPGTRAVGLAVMKGGELREWRVKTFKGSWSHGKLKDVLYALMNYVAEHSVKMIALKKPDVLRSSPALDQLVSEITVWAKMNRIKVTSYTLSELKQGFFNSKNVSKAEIINQLIIKYPELQTEYNKEKKNRNSYYAKMFEAVLVCQFRSKKSNLKMSLDAN